MKISEWLNGPGADACLSAREWLATLPEGATMSEAWAQCRRADWMFWAGFRSPVENDDPRWRQAGLAIVRRTEAAPGKTNWDIMPEAAQRCVEVAERYERGAATRDERRAAEYASEEAAWCSAWYAARSAAWHSAWYAAWYAALSAARSQQADILREFIADPWGEK